MSLYQRLGRVVETDDGERKIHSFLKANPAIVWGLCCNVSGHDDRVISEFCLGTDYRADFVVLNSYSGVWAIHFIELEPANVALFNKSGRPADRLSGALQQIRDWKSFAHEHPSVLKDEIAKKARENDLLNTDLRQRIDLVDFRDADLQDRYMYFDFKYHIVCSRKLLNTKEELKKKGAFLNEKINIATYDRLLHIARCFDEQRHHFE